MKLSCEDFDRACKLFPGTVLLCAADGGHRIRYAGAALSALLGCRGEPLPDTLALLVCEEDRDRVLAALETCSAGDGGVFQCRLMRADGSLLPAACQWQCLADEADGPLLSCLFTDASAQSAELEKLEAANHELSDMIRSLPVGIVVYRIRNGERHFVDANNYALQKLRVTAESFRDDNQSVFLSRVHPDDIADVFVSMGHFSESDVHTSFLFRYADGSGGYQRFRVDATTLSQPDGSMLAFAVFHDVTREEQTHRELEISQQKYALAIEAGDLSVWEYDVQAHTITSGSNLEESGFPVSVADVPDSILPYYSEEDRAKIAALYRGIENGEDRVSGEFWSSRTSAEPPRCEKITYSVVKDRNGRPVKAYGLGQDITAQKLEQERFSESLQNLLSANPQSLCAFQLNLSQNRCTFISGSGPEASEALAADTADGMFDNLSDIITEPEDKVSFRMLFERSAILKGFAVGKCSLSMDYRCKAPGGKLWVRTCLNMLRNPATKDVEGVLYSANITKEKRSEDIFRIVTDQEFDYVALLHIKTNKIEFLDFNNRLANEYCKTFGVNDGLLDFDEVRHFAADRWIDRSDKAEYLKKSPLAVICRELDQNGHYELNIRGHYTGHPEITACRKVQHYYLGDDRSCILVLQSDVTETYQHQQAEVDRALAEVTRVKDIMDSITTGICVLEMPDPSHLRIDYVNMQMYRILGFQPLQSGSEPANDEEGELISRYLRDAYAGIHPKDRAQVMQVFRENFDAEHFSVGSYRILGADGRYVWLQQDVTLCESLPDRKVFYATYREVGEEMRLQEELTDKLEREKYLMKEALAANEAKSEFLSRLSRDIRTPMDGILDMTRIARQQANPARTADCLAEIDSSSKQLHDLINNILDMTKIESGEIELHPEPYPADELYGYLGSVIRPLCEEKRQTFLITGTPDAGCVPLLDKPRFNQILFNLLSNAVKYTPEGGTIEFRFSETISEGRMLLSISVVDNGIGMSKEFQDILFQPFAQENRGGESAPSGTGLGLAIVKRIVDVMGGVLKVESDVGAGSTFSVITMLDCVPADGGQAVSPASAPVRR